MTDAASPTPVGALPLPHYQNEDVSIGGNRLLISTDGGAGGAIPARDRHLGPRRPKPASAIKMEPAGEGHTASCIDAECRWVWVAGDR